MFESRLYLANLPFSATEDEVRAEISRISDELARLHGRTGEADKLVATIVQMPKDRNICECGHTFEGIDSSTGKGTGKGHGVFGLTPDRKRKLYGKCQEDGCTCLRGFGRFRGFAFVSIFLPEYLSITELVRYCQARRFGDLRNGRVLHVEHAGPRPARGHFRGDVVQDT